MGKRWGSFTRYTDARESHPLRKQSEICWVFIAVSLGGIRSRYVRGFLTSGGGISLRFSFRFAGKNQRHVLPRLLNICVLGRALSESCYFCLGDSAGDEARKKHRLQVSLWLPFPQGRLPANRAGVVVADWKADKVNQTWAWMGRVNFITDRFDI